MMIVNDDSDFVLWTMNAAAVSCHLHDEPFHSSTNADRSMSFACLLFSSVYWMIQDRWAKLLLRRRRRDDAVPLFHLRRDPGSTRRDIDCIP